MEHAPCEQFRSFLLRNIGEHPLLSLAGNDIHVPQSTAYHQQPPDDIAEQSQQSTGHIEVHRVHCQNVRRDHHADCPQQRRHQRQHCHAVTVRMKPEQVPQPVFHGGEHHAQPQQSQCQLNDAVAAGCDQCRKGTVPQHFRARQHRPCHSQHQYGDKPEKYHIPEIFQRFLHQFQVVGLPLFRVCPKGMAPHPLADRAKPAGLLAALIVIVLFFLPVPPRNRRFFIRSHRLCPLEFAGDRFLEVGTVRHIPAAFLFLFPCTGGIFHLPHIGAVPLGCGGIFFHQLDCTVIAAVAGFGVRSLIPSGTGGVDKGHVFPPEVLGGKAFPQHRCRICFLCCLCRLAGFDVGDRRLDVHQFFRILRRRGNRVIAGTFPRKRTLRRCRIHQLFGFQCPAGQGLFRGVPDSGAFAVRTVFV